MEAREVIARHLCQRAGQGWSGISPYERGVYRTRAHNILAEVDAAGFIIMPKEDVEAVRNTALDRASEAALTALINFSYSTPRLAAKVENAILSLKSGGRDGKETRE